MLFLNIELEVDGAGAGGCYAELYGRWISLVIRVVQDGLYDGAYAIEETVVMLGIIILCIEG